MFRPSAMSLGGAHGGLKGVGGGQMVSRSSFTSSSQRFGAGRSLGMSSFEGLAGGSSGGLAGGSSGGLARGSFGGSSGGSFGGSGGRSASGMSGCVLVGNEKETMMKLNDRLCTYLQKVKDMEEENNKLEMQLKQFQVGKAISDIDYAAYDAVIKPLREEILALHLGNARLALDLDNATLAAKDFTTKFENELCIKQSVECDIADLKALKEEYIMNYSILEGDIAAANDDLANLKKNHEEEMAELRKQVAGTVTVDVSAEASADLTKQLNEMRESYNALCKKNQSELDDWYKLQVETQTKQTVEVSEAAKASSLEIKELYKQLQALEAEYNSLLSGNAFLEANIQNINDSYCGKLDNLKMTVSRSEMELTNLRSELEQKVKDYATLLNIKMRLEAEIENYKKLLDGSAVCLSGSDSKETSGGTTATTIRTETRTVTSY
ncbi:keratin, type I cytoskeletal 10-like [Hemiscyllium ocellatum]|uniref:keratin, type I cytoskeletal 10-like n=1 Tax=Hemiscyllium ocellatum TaxID=170820 RepID=UPI002966421A|nr:keratin, type I cytoskeletal 10-like [Hemiscyllium ocellatum]